MNRERFERLKELFSESMSLAPEERESFLSSACGDDHALRAEIEQLIVHADAAAPEFLNAESPPNARAETDPPLSIPGFVLLERVAVGASGLVYRARQLDPPRDVAIKVLRLDALAPGGIRRFRREAEILAAFNHTGIAKVHGAGVAGSPTHEQPWIAMEFVRGVTLDAHARATRPSVHRVIELTCELCSALDHAHQRGVVHRDLKPSNVMIDGDGRLCVLDFGVARVLSDVAARPSQATSSGSLIGTLAYMAPEQARGDRDAVDARADVYALGAMLFELLCGRLPLELDELDLLDAVRALQEEEPPRIRQLRPDLPPDLDAIVGKCLEKSPQHRYHDAGALGRDLANLLAERPVQARRPTVGYQTRKFLARHRSLTFAAGGVIFALSVGLVVALRGLEAEHRQLAQTSETLDFFAGKLSELSLELGFSSRRRPLLEAVEARIRKQLESDADNRDLNVALARALSDLAWLDQSEGKYASQREHAEAALQIRERLIEEHPDDLESWTHMSELYAKIGEAVRDRGNEADGDRWFSRALELDERLVREHPGDNELLEDLGWSLERAASAARRSGDPARARDLVERRLADARRMSEQEPRNWKYALNLSHALLDLSQSLRSAGTREDATAAELEGVRCARLAVEIEPQRRALSYWLTQVCLGVAERQLDDGRPEIAWPLAEESLIVAEHVALGEPDRTEHVESLRRAAQTFARAAREAGQPHGELRAAGALRRVSALIGIANDPRLAQALLDEAMELDPSARGR